MKRYLITGASSGIGKTCTENLLEQGNDVIAVSRSVPSITNERLVHFECDLSLPGSGIKLVEKLKDRKLLPIDGVVHCAGVAPLLKISENELEKVEGAYEVNLFSFIDIMDTLKNRGGYCKGTKIVVLSSVVSSRGSNRQSLYAGTKAALEEVVRCYAESIEDVRINAIVSGAVRTDMLQKLEAESPGLEDRMKKYYPLGVIDVEKIWEAVEFLLSDKSDIINGVCFPYDSGYLL